MQKTANLEFVTLGIGLKAPLKVVSGNKLSMKLDQDFYATSIPPSDVSMVNSFQLINSFQAFRGFVEKYGLEMFRPQLERAKKKLRPDEDMFLTVAMMDHSQILESVLVDIWNVLLQYIRKTQEEVRSLMKNKVSDFPAYCCQLEKGLSATRVRVSRHKKRNDYAIFLSGRGIKEACFLQVALNENEVSVCDRSSCPNTFLKTRGKKYCSDSCMEAARKEKRLKDPLEKQRRKLRERAARRRLKKRLTPNEEKECRREINAARTIKKLREIEKKYGLQKQPAGRKRT